MTETGPTPPPPSFAEATRVWARVGLLGFGGPAGQIALLHREVVEERRWVSEARFLHALEFCMLLPGPEAQQLATWIGWSLHGTRGGVVAGTLFVLPGLVVVLALSALYAVFHQTNWLQGLFFGLAAAVVAIVAEALVRIGRRALHGRAALATAIAAFLALFVFAVPFPLVIVAAGLLGWGANRLDPRLFARARKPEDDAAERPGGWATAGRTLVVWGAVWAAPAIAAVLVFGPGSTFAALALFFSKMAVVGFGGAYALLAWVAQAAVSTFGWLTADEMVHGLALAETTPGPLVLVLSFVGFLAGFRDAAGLPPLIGGILGGTIVAWATFAPSFLWIFLFAPHVEALRRRTGFAAALAAIGAAVVGVIADLALWFALQVLFRETARFEAGPIAVMLPVPSSLDPVALALTAIAIVAIFSRRAGVPTTLAVCGAAGLALKTLG